MISDDVATVEMSRVNLDVIVGSFSTRADVERRSNRTPGAIVASTQGCIVALDGLVVEMRRDVFRLLLALIALRGAPLSRADAEFMLWGDRYDGGPDSRVVDLYMMQVRTAAAVIGYHVDTRYNFGWSARRFISEKSIQAAE